MLVLVAAAPLLALLVVGTMSDRELNLANARSQAMELARLGAERQADGLQEARALLLALRRMPTILGDDRAECHATLVAMIADYKLINTLGVADGAGTIWCHNLTTERKAISDGELLRQTLAPGAPLFNVGTFRIGYISGKPTVITASPLPHAEGDKAGGIVFASLNLDAFEHGAGDLVGSSGRAVLLIDPRTGTLLSSTPDHQPLVGRSFGDAPLVRAILASPQGGVIETKDLMGVPRIFAFMPLPGVDAASGVIAVGLSRADVLADAHRRLAIGLAIALLATAGALCAAWLLADASQIRPIRNLVRTARQLGRGNLSARSSVDAWQAPELRMLGSTLNGMATAIARAQKELQNSEAQLRILADNSTDMIFRLDLEFRRTYVSPACREILGFEQSELLGKKPVDMAHPEDAERVLQSYRDLIASRGQVTTSNRIRHRDGHWVWIEVHKRALFDAESGAPLGILGAMRDISKRKEVEAELEAANRRLSALASQDGLTGLANRRSLNEQLEQEWLRAARDDTPLSVIMLDVDHFKLYNDLYGHLAGDECLCAVARAIESVLGRPGDFAARYGGEEFVVILPNTDAAGTAEIAERIRSAVQRVRLPHRGTALGIMTISAGAACRFAANACPSPRELLALADTNLYAAKAGGRNRVVQGTLSSFALAASA
jgi:diguanylate cyclase (GGDEF)-like protein/PAS domain S-box-containing protein